MQNDKRNPITTVVSSALISSTLIAPFVYLELRYASQNYSEFPYPLFAVMWLLPATFFIASAPLLRSLRTPEAVLAHPVSLVFRIASLALLAAFWIGLIQDQLPCFLGVPNCD
jgi:hypothetical protein